MNEITLEMAEKALEAAERWARDIAGQPCSIAVVDKSGTPIAVHRMDGAPMVTPDIAISKAWTAVYWKAPTFFMARQIDPRNLGKELGSHAMGMVTQVKGRLCCIEGGIPIRDDDFEVIGAIGTSGINPAGDISDTGVSQAGWSALFD